MKTKFLLITSILGLLPLAACTANHQGPGASVQNVSGGGVTTTSPGAPADHGGTDGGGGSVIECQAKAEMTIVKKDSDDNPVYGLTFDQKFADSIALSHGRKYELTDLWEAENGYGPFETKKLVVNYDDTTSVDQQISDAVAKLQNANPKFAKSVQKYLDVVRSHILPIHQNDYVLLPHDTDIRYLKKGCGLDGLGYYSDKENNLVIDPEIRKELSKTDEAAFFMHEAIYKTLREENKEKNSWNARRMVGYLFSGSDFTWSDIWKNKDGAP